MTTVQTTHSDSTAFFEGDSPWQEEQARSGRDLVAPSWLGRSAPQKPIFDSVVVRGGGLAAMTLAAQLARSEVFAGRVVVAGPKADTSARLIGGCTLRARALDYYALAFGATRQQLIVELFGDRADQAATYRQLASTVTPRGEHFRMHRVGAWTRAAHRSPAAALAFGLRNGHLKGVLERRLESLPIQRVLDLPSSFAECRDLAPGARPLVVNVDFRPLDDVPDDRKPVGWVIASQVALRRGSRERDNQRDEPMLKVGDSLITTTKSPFGMDMGVYYPFADPLTPDADYYGIYYRVVPPDEKARQQEHQLALRSTAEGVARVAGLYPTAAAQTRGEAAVPRHVAMPVLETPGDLLQLQHFYDACTPIIAGDGMSRAAAAGWLAARAILAGEDAEAAVRLGLQRWRRANRNLALALTHGAPLTRKLLRLAPGPSVRILADVPDMWAGVG